MSIEFRKGDIWKSGYQYIVVPVNCLGVMGAGLAKQVARNRPNDSEVYKRRCQMDLRPGQAVIASQTIFVATKNHWRNPSKLEWVREGLTQLNNLTLSYPSITSIALPYLGCGCGGLRVDKVKPLMLELLQNKNCKFLVIDRSHS